MSNWTATNELRIIDRKFKWISSEGDYEERAHPVLQQEWEAPVYDAEGYQQGYVYERRDVPVEEEE